MNRFLAPLVCLVFTPTVFAGQPKLIAEDWDYAPAMKAVTKKFTGTPGVVVHFGDSITHANPYSQWARYGKGKTTADEAICKWMHTGKNNELDGWYLCSVDKPGGRSETAAGGMRIDQFLKGGHNGLPSLGELLKKYNPQIATLMLGTNDASAGIKVEDYKRDMEKGVDLILTNGTICILSTIPPHPGQLKLVKSYNIVLRQLAKAKKIPLIDYEQEILKRRPDDWNGTLLGKNDVHPTANQDGATGSSEPTEQNLKNSGYLLRGWLSVQKIAEVKKRVLDNP
jgi:lysophospholipase L1-like esterase